jgi:1,3-beta-glucanosyltransferase GAS1
VPPSYTRQGTPTPIQPDFSNLKAQWATANPKGPKLSAYSGVTVTPRACPSSTAGGWAVDPTAPLPTLGQSAVNFSGDGSTATLQPPRGSGNEPAKQASKTGGGSETQTDSRQASSTTAEGSAAQSKPSLFSTGDASVASCILGLLTIGAAAVLLL